MGDKNGEPLTEAASSPQTEGKGAADDNDLWEAVAEASTKEPNVDEGEDEGSEKKTSDAIIDDLFSTLKNTNESIDDIITDVAKSRGRDAAVRGRSRSRERKRERSRSRSRDRKKDRSGSRSRDRKRDRSKSRSRSHSRRHKHKKSKKEKKSKKRSSHRSRSREHKKSKKERERRSSSSSSEPSDKKRISTSTLGEITIKTKNLDDLKEKEADKTILPSPDPDDELPVGADYTHVLKEAKASAATAGQDGDGAQLPCDPSSSTAVKKAPYFPLSKTHDDERVPVEETKPSDLLKKVVSEKGLSALVPRKMMDTKKTNGVESYGPAPPPPSSSTNADPHDGAEGEDESLVLKAEPIKQAPKISIGQIKLKVGAASVKEEPAASPATTAASSEKEIAKDVVVDMKKEEPPDVTEDHDDSWMEANKPIVLKDITKEDGDIVAGKENVEIAKREKKASKKAAVRRRESSSDSDEGRSKSKKMRKEKDDRSRKDRERDRTRRRSRTRSRDRKNGRRDVSRSRDRRDRERRDERNRRGRTRSPVRNDRRDRRRTRSPSRTRVERKRSRSRSAEKIDKKKLLEIALQNSKASGGGGGGGANVKGDGMNTKILEKAGGRNIGDIVSYCQKLAEEEKNELGGGGRQNDSDSDDERSAYRRREIRMNIPDSKQLPTRTPQERLLVDAPLRTAFPVSSGTIHRESTASSIAPVSEWRKVDSTIIPTVCMPDQKKLVATSSLTKAKAERDGVILPPPQLPILPPPPLPPTIRGDLIPPPPPPPSNPFVAPLVPPPPQPPMIITPTSDRMIDMGDDNNWNEVR